MSFRFIEKAVSEQEGKSNLANLLILPENNCQQVQLLVQGDGYTMIETSKAGLSRTAIKRVSAGRSLMCK